MIGVLGELQSQFIATGTNGRVNHGYVEAPNLMVRTLTGSPTWIVVYQGSPNGVDWTTIITHDSATNSSGETVWIGAERYPCLYQRLYCVALSGGTVEAYGWAGRLEVSVR